VALIGFGDMIKYRLATEDIFPTLGLIKSSKASNSRQSVSKDGINPQTEDISFCQGNQASA